MPDTEDPGAIFQSLTRLFAGRMDVKLTKGLDDAPLLKASGLSFAMLHDGRLVVALHPMRCEQLVGEGKGELFVHDGQTYEQWFVVDGLDGALWKSHTMEALAHIKD